MSCLPDHHELDSCFASDAELLCALDVLFVDSTGASPTSEWPAPLVPVDTASPRVLASTKTTTVRKPVFYPKRKFPPMENRSRNKQREELEYLRCTVESLEGRLSALKQRRVPKVGDSLGDAKTAMVGRVTEANAWREFALRQLEQRQNAEVKNKKLRKMLKDQVRLAKSLEKLLIKTEDPEQIELLAPPVHTQFRPPLESQAMFDFLKQDLADMYQSVDSVFGDARFSSSACKIRDIQVRPDAASSGMAVEIIESKTLPFDLHATASAIWEQSAHLDTLNGVVIVHEAAINTEPSSYLKEFSVVFPVDGANGTFRGKIAGRQYIEPHRVVVMWSTYSEPRDVADMDGLALRHRGWTVIQNPGSGSGESLIQSFQLAVPEATQLMADTQHRLSTFAKFLLGAVDFQLTAGHQVVENLLLEEMRRQRGHAVV